MNRFTVGWTAYFALADTPSVFEELDEWLRSRLRQVRWKEWKRPPARRRNLLALGTPAHKAREWAATAEGLLADRWLRSAPARACPTPTGPTSACADSAIPTAASGTRREPPDADPHVGWCGGGRGKPGSYPIVRTRSLRETPEGPATRSIGELVSWWIEASDTGGYYVDETMDPPMLWEKDDRLDHQRRGSGVA